MQTHHCLAGQRRRQGPRPTHTNNQGHPSSSIRFIFPFFSFCCSARPAPFCSRPPRSSGRIGPEENSRQRRREHIGGIQLLCSSLGLLPYFALSLSSTFLYTSCVSRVDGVDRRLCASRRRPRLRPGMPRYLEATNSSAIVNIFLLVPPLALQLPLFSKFLSP